jgi:excisionase family DNA binding protein
MQVQDNLTKEHELLDRLTIDETAEELRMSPGWVRHHVRNGNIPVIRLGYKFFIKKSTVTTIKNKGLPL